MSNSEPRIKDFFVKEVTAPSFEEAFAKMSDWTRGRYDMYALSVEPSEDLDGYIKVYLVGWENESSREYYAV